MSAADIPIPTPGRIVLVRRGDVVLPAIVTRANGTTMCPDVIVLDDSQGRTLLAEVWAWRNCPPFDPKRPGDALGWYWPPRV